MGLFDSLARTAMHSAAATGAGMLTAKAVDRRFNGSGEQGANQPVLRPGADALYFNQPLDLNQRVFGVPGASLHFANLNADALAAGIKGEQAVASELERIASTIPNMYVFHSVKLPGHMGDIDHMVVLGNKVILVDSKNWKQDSSYVLASYIPGEDVVWRDREEFAGNRIHLTQQLNDWITFLPDFYEVETGVLVVANHKSALSDVRNDDAVFYLFSNLNDLEANIKASLRQDLSAPVPPLVLPELQRFALLAQNPDFDPSDAVNYVYPGTVEYQQLMNPYGPAGRVVSTRPPVTSTSVIISVWSTIAWLLTPILYVIIPLSAVPLLIVAHRHLNKINREGLGGKGLTITTLVFAYLHLGAWLLLFAVGGIIQLLSTH